MLLRFLPLAAFLFAPLIAPAQSGSVDLRGTVGYTTFLDESPQGHLFTGGSVRYYLTPRFAIEPEALYLYKDSTDRDYGAAVNVSFDFRGPQAQVRPYVIGGVGVLRTVQPFFSSNELMVSGGFGTKIYLGRSWFVAPEARLGFEPIFRVTMSVGYTWGRR